MGFGLWGLAVLLELPESNELMLIISITVYAALIAIPVTFIHGVFRYGAFGVQTRRSRCRRAALLIAAHRHPVRVRGRRTGGAPRLTS